MAEAVFGVTTTVGPLGPRTLGLWGQGAQEQTNDVLPNGVIDHAFDTRGKPNGLNDHVFGRPPK